MKIQYGKHIAGLCGTLASLLILQAPVPARAQETPAPHDGISCRLCHGAAQPIAMVSQEPRSTKCAGCHAPDEAWQVNHPPLTRGGDSACLTCHTFHKPSAGIRNAVVDPRLEGPLLSLDSGHCAACHNREGRLGTLSPAHEVAGEIYHRQQQELKGLSPSEACLNCHGAGSNSPWQGRTEKTLVFQHQASHAYGRPVRPGQRIQATTIRTDMDPRLPLIKGRMECVTCHSLTAGTDALLVAYENPYDLCLGCHQMQEDQPAAGLLATFVRR